MTAFYLLENENISRSNEMNCKENSNSCSIQEAPVNSFHFFFHSCCSLASTVLALLASRGVEQGDRQTGCFGGRYGESGYNYPTVAESQRELIVFSQRRQAECKTILLEDLDPPAHHQHLGSIVY